MNRALGHVVPTPAVELNPDEVRVARHAAGLLARDPWPPYPMETEAALIRINHPDARPAVKLARGGRTGLGTLVDMPLDRARHIVYNARATRVLRYLQLRSRGL